MKPFNGQNRIKYQPKRLQILTTMIRAHYNVFKISIVNAGKKERVKNGTS